LKCSSRDVDHAILAYEKEKRAAVFDLRTGREVRCRVALRGEGRRMV
jgi:hypothetical protein